jgi:putative membrane protein
MNVAGWTLGPQLAYVIVAAAVWELGGRRGVRTPPWRAASFWGGLASIVIALDSPIDSYADQLFWVHMFQHVLLLTVAPPLLVLARPGPRMLHALPTAARRGLAHGVARSRWAQPLRWLAAPAGAWLAFNGVFAGWHVPALYDAALRSAWIHDLEHLTFFVTALLFWARALGAPPLHARLDWPRRIAYVTGALLVGWVLAVLLALAPNALYGAYAQLSHRPGGLSALADQQLAAGVMWVPGSIAYTIAIVYCLIRWLEPARTPTDRGSSRPALTT